MTILIVDDSLDKLSEVIQVLIDTGFDLHIETIEDIQGAMSFLERNQVDLLILDQFLPIRRGKGEKILEDGGKYLLKEIARRSDQIYPPKYTIGLSQYFQDCSSISDIWQLHEYSPTHTKWHSPLINMVKHVSKVNSISESSKEHIDPIPTLYVEGMTDSTLLQKALNYHFPEFKDRFAIVGRKNAGANWVAQQMVIWGHQLKRNSDGELIKAIGLFDSDEAGIIGKKDAQKKLTSANQQSAVKIRSIDAKYSENLIEYYKRGLQIEIEIESLFSVELLNHADRQEWLEYRNPLFVEPPKDLDQMSETVPDYLRRIDFPLELSVYLKKVKLSKKEQFSQYVMEQSENSIEILDNIKKLIADVVDTLFP